jgi:hypothetical protein
MPVTLPPDPLEKMPATLSPDLPEEVPPALSPDLLEKMDAYWRAANYLSVGQIYLKDNPLLESPLRLEHIKPRHPPRVLSAMLVFDCQARPRLAS